MVLNHFYSESQNALRDIVAKPGDYVAKVRSILSYNTSHPNQPIVLHIGDMIDGLFVGTCARSLRDSTPGNLRNQLIRDFRASLSRTCQIIFDVHIQSESDFLC
jgi:hypothetical protein